MPIASPMSVFKKATTNYSVRENTSPLVVEKKGMPAGQSAGLDSWTFLCFNYVHRNHLSLRPLSLRAKFIAADAHNVRCWLAFGSVQKYGTVKYFLQL